MTFKEARLIPHLFFLTHHPIVIVIMGKAITKIVYKPDTQSSDEYLVIVNPEEVRHPLQITGFNPAHSSLT